MPSTREYRSVIQVQSDVTGMASMDAATAGLTKMGVAAADADKELAALSSKTVTVNVNTEALAGVRARVAELRTQMAEALRLDVTADTAPAQAELRKLAVQERELRKAVEVPLKVPPVVTPGAGEATSELGDLKNELFGLVGITPKLAKFAPTVALAGAAIESIRAGSDLAKVENQLTTLTGSAENMRVVMEGIDKLSVTLPIKQSTLEQGAVSLAKFNVEADKIPTVLGALGNVSLATGVDMGTLTTKFGQLNAVGVTQTRTITGLVKQGIPVYQALAKSMGITVTQAQALAKAGSLTTDEIQGMVTTLGQMDAGAASAQAQTLTGQLTLLGNTVEKVMQQVGQAIGPTVSLIAGDVKLLASAFGALPTPVLATAADFGLLLATMKLAGPALDGLATRVGAWPGKIKGMFGGVTAASEEAGVAAEGVGAAAEGAGSALGSVLGFLGGPWGVGLAVGVVGLTALSKALFGAKHDTEAWTQALEYQNGALATQNGALSDANAAAIVKHLNDSKVIDDANQLGISTKTLIEAYAGQADAVKQVQDATTAASDAGSAAANASKNSTGVLTASQAAQQKQTEASAEAARRLSSDLSDSSAAMQTASAAAATQAAETDAAKAAQQDMAGSTLDLAQMEAGLKTNLDAANTALTTVIDSINILNGTQLDANDAARGYNAAQRAVTQAVKDYDQAVKAHGKNSADAATAADSVSAALDNQARAAQAVIEAQLKNGASIKDVNKLYQDQRTALLNAAIATGMSAAAAKKYVDEVLKTPKDVTVEFNAVQKGFDAVQQAKDDLSKSVIIDISTSVDWTNYWKLADRLSALGRLPAPGGAKPNVPSAQSMPPQDLSAGIQPFAYAAPAVPSQTALAGAPQVHVYVQDRKLAGLIDVQVRQAAGAARMAATRRRVIQV